MAKTKTTPAMEGTVNREIDFNLKKEDLMLLILEGRKEVMEMEISALQTKSNQLKIKMTEAQHTFKKKLEKLILKTLNSEAKALAEAFGVKGDDEKVFNVNMRTAYDIVKFTKFMSSAIGNNKGGSFIKTEVEGGISIELFPHVRVDINMTLHGTKFTNKSNIYRIKDTGISCTESSRMFVILDTPLDIEEQKLMPEYLSCKAIAEELAKNESLYSDIITEYDLFNRNQPRAKAKMIKEVLARDEAGQAILANIITAASGVKLLS